jgi:hypothetical protein
VDLGWIMQRVHRGKDRIRATAAAVAERGAVGALDLGS